MKHFILTNFKTKKKNGKFLTIRNANDPAPNGTLYYSSFKLSNPRPSDNTLKKKCLVVEKLNPSNYQKLINEIVATVMQHPSSKKDVLVFTHGYTPLPKSHKLSLLYDLDERYVKASSTIGTIIYFSWPGFGLSMSNNLGVAYKVGQELANHFTFFADLSQALPSAKSKMHLMVQSWGHRVLSSVVNKLDLRTSPYRTKQHRVFQNVFLMAADCPSKSLRENGVTNAYRNYNLRRLKFLSNNIFVFYDKDDGILEISNNQVELQLERLGKIGFPPNTKLENFHFLNADKVDPFLPNPNNLSTKHQRHRYLVTSDKIVEKISDLIKQFSGA